MKKVILIISFAFLLVACSSQKPTDPNWRPDLTTANFGKYPTNYPVIIKKWGEKNFDNHNMISYLSMSNPREEYLVINPDDKDVIYGYSVCAIIGGIKNESYYKPFKKYWFFIRDGKIIDQRDLDAGYNTVIYRDHKINCDDKY